MNDSVDPNNYREFTRAEAIAACETLFDPDYMEEEDREDYEAMTDDELGEVLCTSGIIHDSDFGGIVG